MLLWPWLLATTTWAAAPTGAPGTFDTGAGGAIVRLALSKDAGVATGVTSSGQLVLLDVAGWRLAVTGEAGVTKASCSVSSALAVPQNASDPTLGYDVFLGCTDGTVQTWQWQDDVLAPRKTTSGTSTITLTGLGGEVFGLFPDATSDATIYALVKASTNLTGNKLTIASGVLTKATTPVASFLQSGFKEAFPVGSAGVVVVWHGSSGFSQWSLAAGTVVGTTAGATSGYTPVDVAPGQAAGAYLVEAAGLNAGRVGYWNGQSGTALQTIQAIDPTFGGGTSIVRTYREATSWFVVQKGAQIAVYGTATTSPLTLDHAFDVNFTATNLWEGPAGYVLGTTNEGELVVLTANPWIDAVALSDDTVATGDPVSLSFDVDAPVTWKVRAGGTRTGGGTALASGELAAAGTATAAFTVPASLDEGGNAVWIDVATKDGSGGTGHARTLLTVDNPPPAVVLRKTGVGVGDRAVYLEFPRLTERDIVGYHVYVSTTPFTAADHPVSGGPKGKVGGVTSPVTIDQPGSGSTVTAEIHPLKNGTTYWVAVRATDASTEGGMSDVFAVTPEPTLNACDLKGDACDPGPPCSTTPLGVLGWAASLGAAAAVRRRRARALAAAALVVATAVVAPSTARADDRPTASAASGDEAAALEADREADRKARLARRRNRPTTGIFAHDTTQAWADFEFKMGSFALRDNAIEAVYGQHAPLMQVEAGVQLFRYAEIDLGIGYLWRKGNTLSASTQTPSAEQARMQWMPLSLGATLRAHVLDEQPIVPYGSVGFSWVFWREQALDAEGLAVKTSRVNGSDYGWYWAAGGNILLDLLHPRRASILEATSGINDTWLTVEYRQQMVNANGTKGFDLSGWNVSVGLKLDY